MPGILKLEAVSSAFIDATTSHPNRMKFRGILVRLDENSTKAPNGSNGHKILVPASVAKSRLKTLIGMGLNYAPSLDGHAQRRKVGVIEKAGITGRDLWVEGTVWKHDFPEATTDLKQHGLGMSMEIGEVHVEDVDAEVWKLTDFYFLGATILTKKAAAYYKTQAIAAKADEGRSQMKTAIAKKTTVKEQSLNSQQIAEIAAAKAAEKTTELINGSVLGLLKRQTKMIGALKAQIDGMEIEMEAKKGAEDEEDIDAEGMSEVGDMRTKMKAKKKDEEEEDEEAAAMKDKKDEEDDDGDEDDDEMETMADGVNKGDLEELGPDLDDDTEDDDDPGHLNQGATNHGNKTTSMEKVGKTISKGVTGAQYEMLKSKVKALASKNAKLEAANAKLSKQVGKVSRQVSAHAQEVNRRSITPEMTGLLAKSGLDPIDLRQTGTKLTVAEVDAIIARPGLNLDITKRMALKNEFYAAGLLEDGEVKRPTGAGR